MKKDVTLYLLTLIICLSCAVESNHPQTRKEDTHSSLSNPAATEGKSCEAKNIEPLMPNIDLSSDMVFMDNDQNKISLCNIVLSNPKKVIILGFAGVYCLSCQIKAEETVKKLKELNLTNEVALVFISTDQVVDAPRDALEHFQQRYAKESSLYRDINIQLWKKYRGNINDFDRPYLILNPFSKKAYLQNANSKYLNENAAILAQDLLK